MAKARSKKMLRVAFIGAGGIAGAHMRYLAEMDDVEIVALADISKKSMAQRQEEYGIDAAYTDYRKMLREVKPDAVSVCTPNGLHAEGSIAASKAGAHVIVEKPMAMTAAEAQKMITAAKSARRKLVIGFQHRYDARTQFIKSAVDAGRMGKVVYGRIQALRRRGIPNWGVFGRKDLQGGGPLIDIGVHALEMTHYAMGSPKPVAASGSIFTYLGDKKSDVVSMWPNWDHKNYTVEDLAVGQIRFANGAILSIEASFAAHIEKEEWNFTLMGEKAGAKWDPPALFSDDGGYMMNSEPGWMPKTDVFALKMRNFVEHCLYNKPTMAPAEHGLMVQKMLDGIYASAEKKREVVIR
ncbi:MAG: Gfo/Idh/MocA family oxidoreductase [Gemmatimonadetes bacterium]|jgi:predicted dehydrogenase|nr:Gfo/Idh/MocA family oxidoreductase [Gemmatimonadota bacterium]MBT7862741.1 Gfo/Idh/MocA family oxidoreductase [Gemmatimonadota bacterium]